MIDGLTGDQRFFLAWAQVWRSTSRPDALRQQLRAVEDKIIAAAPASMGAGGGDIEAAMRSRKVPVTLKAQRKALVDQLRAAQVQPLETANPATTTPLPDAGR